MKKLITNYICICLLLIFTVTIPINALAATSKVVQVTNDKQFENAIYNAVITHKTSFTIQYNKKVTDILGVKKVSQINDNLFNNYMNQIIQKVFDKDLDTSSDFDYLKWNVGSYSYNISYGSITLYPTIKFTFKYNETAAELKKLNRKTKQILTSLSLSGRSDYDKVKQVHDYLVKHVEYNTLGTGFSAYSALIDKKSVCQGYSLAMYKLLTEAGISCRIITGKGNGVSHAWNIVAINGVWYNIDVTWDDPIGNTKDIRYDYFLKGTQSFYKDHVPDKLYQTKSFIKKYPISVSDYQ